MSGIWHKWPDEKPEEGDTCWAARLPYGNRIIEMLLYDVGKWWFSDDWSGVEGSDITDVTHWAEIKQPEFTE